MRCSKNTGGMTGARLTPMLAALLAAGALAVAPEPAWAQVACPGSHMVRSGETLLAIAERCGVTVPALLAANPAVRGNRDLQVGRDIVVPHPRDPQPTPQQACGAFYTVRSGDTLADVAAKCGLTIPLLVAANGPLPSPLGLNAGGTLRIPDLPPAAVRDTLTWAASAPDTVAAPAADPSPDFPELVRYQGTLEAGTPCMLLRMTDGRTVALDGRPARQFQPGTNVVVMGLPADAAACGGTRAVEVRIVYRP
jgi:LysM repeat protein